MRRTQKLIELAVSPRAGRYPELVVRGDFARLAN